MEPIFKEKNTVSAVEILYFDNAEVEKVKGDSRSFATMGPLSVLYFKDYNRFVLQINDWRYPLLRRLPIMGADKMNLKERMFHLPALNGFSFNLIIRDIHSSEALHNLEVIMRENVGFYYKGEETTFRKMDASPDDKLMRMQKKPVGMMDMMSEKMGEMEGKIKMGMDKMKIAGKQIKKDLPVIMGMDKKRRINLQDIKKRSFKRSAHTTFKKDWFEAHEKMTKDIHVMRKHNFANFKSRSIDDLRSADHLPIFYIPTEDVEESILINKDLAATGKFHMGDIPKMDEKKGFMDQVKQGLNEIKDSITGRVNKAEAYMEKQKVELESMTHYQG